MQHNFLIKENALKINFIYDLLCTIYVFIGNSRKEIRHLCTNADKFNFEETLKH